jgi:hypothetical protein
LAGISAGDTSVSCDVSDTEDAKHPAPCPPPIHDWRCDTAVDEGTAASQESVLNATMLGALMSENVTISTPFSLVLNITELDAGYGRLFLYDGFSADEDGATGFIMSMWSGGQALFRRTSQGTFERCILCAAEGRASHPVHLAANEYLGSPVCGEAAFPGGLGGGSPPFLSLT